MFYALRCSRGGFDTETHLDVIEGAEVPLAVTLSAGRARGA